MLRVLLITPPLLQPNTPYSAFPHIQGALEGRLENVLFSAHDLSLECLRFVFSREGMASFLREARMKTRRSRTTLRLLDQLDASTARIDSWVDFLSLKNTNSVPDLRAFPKGARFKALMQTATRSQIETTLTPLEQAKLWTSVALDEIADHIRSFVDPWFQFSRYGESIASSPRSLAPLLRELDREGSFIRRFVEDRARSLVCELKPDLVAFTIPFPGNLFMSLLIARAMKRARPSLRTVAGGGLINTEWRSIHHSRENVVFDFFDYITLDDGEIPLERILRFYARIDKSPAFVRTFERNSSQDQVVFHDRHETNLPMRARGVPSYRDYRLSDYFSMIESPNPITRLWSDGLTLKLTMAHGCYWKKCTFCDLSLPYIRDYEPQSVEVLVHQILTLKEQTGISTIHFVDEAAPPALIRALSKRLIAERAGVKWWGNIRFEKTFTRDLTALMQEAGCIAVTGGLEVASPRVLRLINKGVTIAQAAEVTRNFRDANILTHAHLMYGFPTQTTLETIDSAEFVRQLFLHNCIQSGFWHRFTATVHAPVGQHPKQFGITIKRRHDHATRPPFAQNDLQFSDRTNTPHAKLGIGLHKSMYNFMLGLGLELPIETWFDFKVPRTTLAPDLVETLLSHQQ